MAIAVGDVTEFGFQIDAAAMEAFAAMANDRSAIHVDAAYARARGFEGTIVYGGLMLAHLSHVLGSRIPGNDGVSTHWSIDYRKPLYVGEAAVLRLEVVHVSPATGLVDCKFAIRASDRVVATGKTQSQVPADLVAGRG
jgi:3-hydroxybutyryl-CoA dehydratase